MPGAAGPVAGAGAGGAASGRPEPPPLHPAATGGPPMLAPPPQFPGQSACGAPQGLRAAAPVGSEASGSTCSVAEGASSTASCASSAQPLRSGSFPERLAPLDLAATSYRAGDFDFGPEGTFGKTHSFEWSLRSDKLGFAAKRFLAQTSGGEAAIRGRLSQVQGMTLPEEELKELGIVHDAMHFAFSYPVVTTQDLRVTEKDVKVPDIAFLVFGGYMCFDADMALQDIRAVMPSEDGPLRFGPPRRWRPQWTGAFPAERWHRVTIPALRDLGVRHFAWLLPGEAVPGEEDQLSKHGGFAYIFHEPAETGVLQETLDVYFEVVDSSQTGSEDAASLPQGKACPKCSRALDWSDCSEGDYASGWDCENFAVCGRAWTRACPHRWFCPACSFDLCGECHSAL